MCLEKKSCARELMVGSSNLCSSVSICTFYVGKGVGAHLGGAETWLSQIPLQCIAAVYMLDLKVISVNAAGNLTLGLLILNFFFCPLFIKALILQLFRYFWHRDCLLLQGPMTKLCSWSFLLLMILSTFCGISSHLPWAWGDKTCLQKLIKRVS